MRFFAVVFASLAPNGVFADLPVHCLRHEVEGAWDFFLGSASNVRSSCGHSKPDNQAMEPPLRHLESEVAAKVTVNLDMPNRASTATDPSGTFTMIYDEGFEVAVDGKNFFAFSRFDLDSMGNNVTNCGETLTGWYHDQEGGEYGCYYGIKKTAPSTLAKHKNDFSTLSTRTAESEEDSTKDYSGSTSTPFGDSMATTHMWKDDPEDSGTPAGDSGTTADPVSENSNKILGSDDFLMKNDPWLTSNDDPLSAEFHQGVVDKLNDRWSGTLLQKKAVTKRQTWNAKLYPSLINKTRKQINKMAGIKRSLNMHDAHMNQHRPRPQSSAALGNATAFLQQSARSKLPRDVDWDKGGALDQVINQGDCGSCFTVATTRMMSARNRIRQNKMDAAPFSIGFPLHCSEYNQGCDGGYAFLQSKWSEDVGLLPESCFPYNAMDSCSRHVDMDCVKANPSYRAHGHRYVGGYYGGSDELDIMDEVANNGPLVVSFEPKDDFMYYNAGIYQSNGDAIHQEWERVDHAVLLVGYGETEQGQKFWKVQNSWGPEWGEHGFFRIARGENDSGVESIAVAADVVETEPSRVEQFLDARADE